MDWKNIASTVGNVAASVAPLLGGPVGMAVSIGSQIAGALGTENSAEAVLNQLQTNPEAALKLQQWEHEEKQQIREAREKDQSREEVLSLLTPDQIAYIEEQRAARSRRSVQPKELQK